ncbi:hypothetical protein J4Q44_G00090410 [Coregonus suidteri]|uniref:Uncharacterized protein n=1 Tax=Coregonus suidteri TaxID=861788 RepID=A0AAN8M0R1_9TELE
MQYRVASLIYHPDLTVPVVSPERAQPPWCQACGPARPVVVEQSWLQPSHEELTLDQELHNTATQLAEMEALPEKDHRPLPQKTSQELYHQPDVKRVKVYHNGDRHVSVHVWGQSIEELLSCSTALVHLEPRTPPTDCHTENCKENIEMRATFAQMMRSQDPGNTTTDRGPKEPLTTTIPCGCHSLHWTAEA